MIATGSLIAAALISGFVVYCLLCSREIALFALLNLFRHKRRSFSTLMAIVIGGVAIFSWGGFIHHAFWILKEQTVRMNVGHIQLYNPLWFQTSNKNLSLINDYQTLKAEIESHPDLAAYIATLSGQLEFTGIISHYENETSSYFSGVGIEPVPALKLGAFEKMLSGSDLSRVRKEEMTLGNGLATTLNAHYADWLDLMVVNSRGGQGAISLKLRGIFSSGIKDYDDVAIKVPLVTAQRMMDTRGVSKVLILLKDDADLPLFRAKLQQFINEKNLPLTIRSWKEISLFYQQVESLLSGIYLFIQVMVAVIVIFMISNAMAMNIVERTREITTLRAIGLKPTHIIRLFLLEGIVIGVLGGAGSLLAGFALAGIVNLQGIAMPPSPGQTHGYTAFIKTDSVELWAVTFLLPVLTSALAAILPSLRASRLNIADAFKFS
ncbi:ABC transporter permease [Pantoea sp. FN0307]|uniref:ABC transporter permease n=1 Tax=Pantoea sp. FN0307 TaxID=3418560 RepID=UPI003CEB30A5